VLGLTGDDGRGADVGGDIGAHLAIEKNI